MRARNDKVETMLLDSQEKLSVFVAANDGREIKAAQVFTGKCLSKLKIVFRFAQNCLQCCESGSVIINHTGTYPHLDIERIRIQFSLNNFCLFMFQMNLTACQ